MKPILKLTATSFVLIFILFGVQAPFSSCTKTVTKTDTVTLTKTDTLVKTVSKDTAITAQLLASRQWEVQYLRDVTNNDTTIYTRGGAYNVNFNSQLLTFNTNFTGSVVDINSVSHTTTWNFTNSANTALTLVVSNPSPLPYQTYNWNNMTYRNDSLLIDQYSSYQGNNSQTEIIWLGVGGTSH